MPSAGVLAGLLQDAQFHSGTDPDDSESALIDDFEAQNDHVELPNGGLWFPFNDGTGQQVPANGSILPEQRSTDGGAGGWLHTSGTGFATWGAGVEGWLASGTSGTSHPVTPYDGSRYTGIRFTYTSAGPLSFEVATVATTDVAYGGSCTVGCNGHFSVALPAASEPTLINVTWDQLYQRSGTPVAFDPTQMLDVQWNFDANVDFDFWLDHVYFVRTPPPDGGVVVTAPAPPPIVVDDFDDLNVMPLDPRFKGWVHWSTEGALDHRLGVGETGAYSWVNNLGDGSVGDMELEWNLQDMPDGQPEYPSGGLFTTVLGYIDLSHYTRLIFKHRYEHTGDCETIASFGVCLNCGEDNPTSFQKSIPVSTNWKAEIVQFSLLHEPSYLPATGVPRTDCLKLTTALLFDIQSPKTDGACGAGHLFLDDVELR